MLDPAFIKTRQGLYRTRGAVTPDCIIRKAADLLLERLCDGQQLNSAQETAEFLRMALADEPNEQFSVIFLNHRNQVIAFETLFQGTISSTTIHPRQVIQRSMAHNAAAIIAAHNHPSGEIEPSKADIIITEKLQKALGLVDMRLLDHFIVTRSGYLSLVERGVI